jgi:DNA gyrase/topoisomerase IV subunit B
MKPDNIEVLIPREAVLKRPEMYIGTVQKEMQKRWIMDDENTLVEKEVEIIPGILKLFDEVISNSVDEAIKTQFKFSNRISVFFRDDNSIEIWDNGRGLSMEMDETYHEYKAVLAFTKLHAGSNFNDTKREGTIGKFGVGVSLTNIFSKKFIVSSVNTEKKSMTLVCSDNMKEIKSKISDSKAPSGTSVRYLLDFEYFGITKYDKIHLGLIKKRVFDLAMNFPGISFFLDGKKVKTSLFKDYVKLINRESVIYEDGYKLAVLPSEDFSQISFVNGIETLRGGNHIDIIMSSIAEPLRNLIKKRYKIEVKPADIRNKVLLILSIKDVPNAKFDSQTKERLVNTYKELVGSISNLSEKFFWNILNKKEIIDPIIETYLIKEKVKERLDVKYQSKQILKKKIPKLIDATSDNRNDCTLFLTEGDSALGQLIIVRERKIHGGLPLRGKVMNALNVTDAKLIKNKEYQDIMKATGLALHEKAENLRYGKIVILTDMDEDGNSITALLINFFYKYWPELFRNGIVRRYMSPLVIAKKGNSIKRFYTLEEFSFFDKEEYSKMINEPIEYIFSEDDFCKESLDIAFGSDSGKRKIWLGK